jgi:hypothetical protein
MNIGIMLHRKAIGLLFRKFDYKRNENLFDLLQAIIIKYITQKASPWLF